MFPSKSIAHVPLLRSFMHPNCCIVDPLSSHNRPLCHSNLDALNFRHRDICCKLILLSATRPKEMPRVRSILWCKNRNNYLILPWRSGHVLPKDDSRPPFSSLLAKTTEEGDLKALCQSRNGVVCLCLVNVGCLVVPKKWLVHRVPLIP